MNNGLPKYADIVIIGLGAAGGILFGKLCEAGLDVVGIDAGPHWDTGRDFASDEREMDKIRWNDPRVSAGNDPLDLGRGTSGKGVGGGTLHYTMMSLRLHPSDFRTRSTDGVGVDWPISLADLESYYDEVENQLPVSGPENFPWPGRKNAYPMRAHRLSCIDEVFSRGASAIGAQVAACPLALVTEPLSGRMPCINRGFCEQGCKPKAKSSTLITYIPRGLEAGGKIISSAMATGIDLNDNETAVRSIEFIKDGKTHRIECNKLIIAAFTIETPRMLLNSKSARFPDGLANTSGTVGKYLMCHTDHVIYARFDRTLRQYRNPPTTSISQHFYETDPANDYVRGFSMAPYAALPINFALGAIAGRSDLWGEKLAGFMKEYDFWMQLGMIGEVLPYEENRVELTDELDDYGLPVPRAVFSLKENENKMIEDAYRKMEKIMDEAGAIERFRAPLCVHLLGTTRMGDDPMTSVVDKNLKAHDLENLYICGGSIFPTSGAVNPTLTVQALSARLTDYLINKDKNIK
jgi:choline dehydrogenase-like flavoprotein